MSFLHWRGSQPAAVGPVWAACGARQGGQRFTFRARSPQVRMAGAPGSALREGWEEKGHSRKPPAGPRCQGDKARGQDPSIQWEGRLRPSFASTASSGAANLGPREIEPRRRRIPC